MARRAIGYTQFVRAMRVLLPLAALAILSTLFLIAERVDTSNPFAFEGLDLTDVLLQPGIKSPSFAGKTDTGEEIRLSAEDVLGGPDQDVTAHDIVLVITDPFGAELNLTAEMARIAEGESTFDFTGKVVLTTSTGIQIETEELKVARDMSRMDFTQPIEADAPFGQFSATEAHVERQMSQEGLPFFRLVFQGGVTVLYSQNE